MTGRDAFAQCDGDSRDIGESIDDLLSDLLVGRGIDLAVSDVSRRDIDHEGQRRRSGRLGLWDVVPPITRGA